MENKRVSRRQFLNKCVGTASMVLGSALFLFGCNNNKSSSATGSENKKQSTSEDPCDDLSGVSDEEVDKRKSLGYVTKTPLPDSSCGVCGLYIPPAGENNCGGCFLFKGPVKAEGYCIQYAPKV